MSGVESTPRFGACFFLTMMLRKQIRFCLLVCGFAGLLSAARADERVIVEQFDERPVPIKAYPPAFPPEMLRQGISGLVNLMIVIDESGKVVERTVVKSTRSEFERPALEAVGKWRFKPALKGGAPVAVRIELPVGFKCEQ